MSDRPQPDIVQCVWDAETEKYVPVASHRGVEILERFERQLATDKWLLPDPPK